MNAVYQDFKKRFGLDGLVIMGTSTLIFAGIGLGIGTMIAMNLHPAVIVLDEIKE